MQSLPQSRGSGDNLSAITVALVGLHIFMKEERLARLGSKANFHQRLASLEYPLPSAPLDKLLQQGAAKNLSKRG
eukprot:15360780-Ditylum_brightwellii.AAC.1